MDMSFMSRFLVQGRDALECLNWLSCNDLNVAIGRIVYTQWTNAKGGIEADLTITRLDEEEFMVVCSDTAHRHVQTWMQRNFRIDAHATVTDLTSARAMLTIQGPKSRALLSGITGEDMSNENFPYLTGREMEIDYSLVYAVRVTYLGELGWELYIPTEQAVAVYDRLLDAGIEFGLRHAGLQALNSLRLEKAYRDYGHDIDNLDTPFEAGLGFAVKLDKPGGFLGRDVLLKQKSGGTLKKRLLQFRLVDPDPLLFHAEVVWRDGKIVGYIRVGGYGHTLGASVGLGMVEADRPIDPPWVENGKWEIEIAGVRHDAVASLSPMYDPKLVRVKY
jgi:4-methylaminobutanoate oxidase (formaldehyde-forming)